MWLTIVRDIFKLSAIGSQNIPNLFLACTDYAHLSFPSHCKSHWIKLVFRLIGQDVAGCVNNMWYWHYRTRRETVTARLDGPVVPWWLINNIHHLVAWCWHNTNTIIQDWCNCCHLVWLTKPCNNGAKLAESNYLIDEEPPPMLASEFVTRV